MVQRVLCALQRAPNRRKCGEKVQDRNNFSSCTCRQRNRGQEVENADRSATLVILHINPLMLMVSRKRPAERRKYSTNASEKGYLLHSAVLRKQILYELVYEVVGD